MLMRPFLIGVGTLLWVALPNYSQADTTTTPLAEGPYSHLEMILKKTIFRVRVIDVQVRFSAATRDQLQTLAKGKSPSDELEQAIADTAIKAPVALIRAKFLRNIEFDTYLAETLTTVKCVQSTGFITESEAPTLRNAITQLLAPLKGRGVLIGDILTYDVTPLQTHIIYRSPDGKVLIDQIDKDETARKAVMGSYFASCSDFREDLIESLFKD